jgi:hypothetical protein
MKYQHIVYRRGVRARLLKVLATVSGLAAVVLVLSAIVGR